MVSTRIPFRQTRADLSAREVEATEADAPLTATGIREGRGSGGLRLRQLGLDDRWKVHGDEVTAETEQIDG